MIFLEINFKMSTIICALILSLCISSYCKDLIFPEGFLFGAGSSAYQVEGAWNTSGKSESIWDVVTHHKKHLMIIYAFEGHEKDSSSKDSTYVAMTPNKKFDMLKSYTSQWSKIDKFLKKSLEIINAPLRHGLSMLKIPQITEPKKPKETNDDLPDRPRIVIDYYHGVPIYEVLPDKLIRSVLELPSASQISTEDLYTLQTVSSKDFSTATADVACDSYNKIDEDVKLLKELGAKIYRFSLSWTRLYPKGNAREFNEDGVKYYNKLIDTLILNNIKPFVTIYHFDLPKHLQMIGGWTNTALITYFKIYVDFVFKTFGDRVNMWTTINEPTVATEGYKSLKAAPAFGTVMSGVADYLAIHNILLAHAYAYDIYKKKYKATQNGTISINVAGDWYYPLDKNNPKDVGAVNAALMFQVGIILHPLTFGDYPEEIKSRVQYNSDRLNISNLRFQGFTEDEQKLIKNSYDFVSLNHYMSFEVTDLPANETDGKSLSELDANIKKLILKSDEELSNMPWAKNVPEGMSSILNWIDKTYNHPVIFISENGYPEPEGFQFPLKKLNYHHDHLEHVLYAMNNYNVTVIGYCAWSLMDSMEWLSGYSLKYGIYKVDFNNDNRSRTKKSSTKWFSEVYKSGKLIEPFLT